MNWPAPLPDIDIPDDPLDDEELAANEEAREQYEEHAEQVNERFAEEW